MKNAIRNQYAELGVDAYYEQYGSVYQNPHFEYIAQLLKQNEIQIDYSNVLDLCCGGGEVTMVLQDLGFSETVGCDPFTQTAFEKNTSKQALSFSFDDIIKGKLTAQYSVVICSFAMHLCPEKQLFSLVDSLYRCTNQIVIITPHKRPELENLQNTALDFEDFVLTERGKKVRLKSYSPKTIVS